ncbi:uncharacterized protein BX664DRAFT_289117 [Halteromyces radiatus]|uniref:uncharacterized protein n=1 Tax=Halteromyces radiatus TaxID=101107 RepID=UPI00221ECF6E|nr:uncharacterized protein BX664DRAFT_289117 [Halteromyces radiatus]KAI8099159.1 hypothetical protein BX664DRAFT_289117 [Halteromyces radiatus]
MAKPGMLPTGRNAQSMNNIYSKPGPSIRSITRLGSLSSLPTPSSSTSSSSSSLLSFGKKPSSNNNAAQAGVTLYADIAEVRQAMDLFLNSRIPECELILNPKRDSSMYHSLGFAFVLFLKACMTFQKEDIEAGLEAMKQAYQMADKFRKRDSSWKNLSAWVKSYSVQDIKDMTPLQRHAELVYAETYLLKAMLQIIYDESFVGFLREGLKMRASHGIYKVLEKYMLHVQEEASLGKDVLEYGLDEHFASGVAFGMGCFNLVLSMLPQIVLKLAEFVGFTGDRDLAMFYFRSVGGWDDVEHFSENGLPELQGPEEGIRRQFCDMMLLLYNIVLSKLSPLSHVDEPLADRVLKYNLQLYPDGIFFLYFSGRQLSAKKQLEQAKAQYHRAISMESSWKQLHHMCYWELGLIALLQQDWKLAHDTYQLLNNESNWSKAVYTYVQALSLYMYALELTPGEKRKQLLSKVNELMSKVTKAKQKIAGKSIFVEKFVARKSRKFDLQGGRLLFPDLEVLNAFSAFELMSTDLVRKNLGRIQATLTRLESNKSFYVYDDLCLCHYLRTMLIRMLLQDPTTPKEERQRLKETHRISIQAVLDMAEKVQLDHYTYYFTVYEKARMLMMDNELDAARKEIQYLIRCSEKNEFNVGAGARAKNKYSLENSLILKCHNCLEMITEIQEGRNNDIQTIQLKEEKDDQLGLDITTTTQDDSDEEFEDAKED